MLNGPKAPSSGHLSQKSVFADMMARISGHMDGRRAIRLYYLIKESPGANVFLLHTIAYSTIDESTIDYTSRPVWG
jgi:hypothetical protein